MISKGKSLLKKFHAMEEDAVFKFANISKKAPLIALIQRIARTNRSLWELDEMAKEHGFKDRGPFLRSLRVRDLADIFTDEITLSRKG